MRPSLTATALLASACLLPLAACNKQPEVSATNASPAEVSQKVAAAGGATMIEPGRWENTITMHAMELPPMPNLPPQAQAQMKAQMNAQMDAPRTIVRCVTAQDVQKAFLSGARDDKSCKFDHFTLSGGKIDAALSCDAGSEGKVAMAMNGTYSAESYHVDASMSGPMSAKMSMDAKRVGACKGTPDEK